MRFEQASLGIALLASVIFGMHRVAESPISAMQLSAEQGFFRSTRTISIGSRFLALVRYGTNHDGALDPGIKYACESDYDIEVRERQNGHVVYRKAVGGMPTYDAVTYVPNPSGLLLRESRGCSGTRFTLVHADIPSGRVQEVWNESCAFGQMRVLGPGRLELQYSDAWSERPPAVVTQEMTWDGHTLRVSHSHRTPFQG